MNPDTHVRNMSSYHHSLSSWGGENNSMCGGRNHNSIYMAGDTENEIVGDGQFEEIPITNDK